jgi:hypothetical protein
VSLGCVNHTVFITDRGGITTVGTLERPTLVRWNRVRDDISNAVVMVRNPGPECCGLISDIRSGRHEMVIYRGSQRVWEGPITRISDHPEYIEIEARDVMHYVYRTIARNSYSSAYPNVETVTQRMERMLLTELERKESLDPPINVLPHLDIRTNSETARTTRSIKRHQMTVWEDIDTMAARGGLDYTVLGRRILGFDVHDVIGRTTIMTDADFLSPVMVTEYGMELCTYSSVTDGEGNYGAVGGTDPYFGEWELLATAYEEEVSPDDTSEPTPPTTAELRSQAARNMAGRNPTPVIVRVPDASLLNPETTALSIDTIIPGIRIPVRAAMTCRTVVQEQKLDKVRVEETERGETVAVTLSPAPGTTPDGLESEGSDD